MNEILAGRQVALGLLPLSLEDRPGRREAHATIEAALAAGVRVIDAADVYGQAGEPPGYSEELLAPVLRTAARHAPVVVATKGGLVRLPDGCRAPRGRPDHLVAACEASLRRLGVDAIDLYQLHRPDPAVPLEDSVGALVDLTDRGLVRSIGVSNVSVEQLDVARRVAGLRLVAVQNALPPRDDGGAVLAECRRLGLAFLAWGVLGGIDGAALLEERWLEAAEIARARGMSVHQVVVARALAYGAVPIVGARRPKSICDSAAAVQVALSANELGRLI